MSVFGLAKEFVSELEIGTSGDQSVTDICKALSSFGKSICAQVFLGIESEVLEPLFMRIWKCLLQCSAHSSSAIRMSVYTVSTVFLMKMAPFFAGILRATFGRVAVSCYTDTGSSIILLSIFAFLSRMTSPSHLTAFLQSTPIFHHFVVPEVLESEYLSGIIENIGPVGFEWYQSLIMLYIRMNNQKPTRHVMKAIGCLVNKYPQELIPCVLENNESIGVAAFVLNSISPNVSLDEIDIRPAIRMAFQVLSNDPSISDMDDAFLVLGLRCPSLQVTIKAEANNQFIFALENASFAFCNAKALKRPAFYSLPLPKSLLVPRAEDSSAIVLAKLKNLANAISDSNQFHLVTDELDIFERHTSFPFTDKTSAVFASVARCVNSLILNGDEIKVARFLRRVLLSKPKSWFHALDLVEILKAVDNDLLHRVFVLSEFMVLLKNMIEFCQNPNENLSSNSLRTVVKLTKPSLDSSAGR
jgi:hypothetical protein